MTYGRCATREQLEELRKEHNVPVANAMLDSGFKAAEVYRFSLANPPGPAARVVLESASDLDGLELARVNADGTATDPSAVLELSRDRTDEGASHNTLATAFQLPCNFCKSSRLQARHSAMSAIGTGTSKTARSATLTTSGTS